MRNQRTAFKVLAGVTILVLLAACAATQVQVSAEQGAVEIPGFLLGLWHGFIAPVTFFVSLFSDHVRIYAVPNTGRLYDFGFMLGIGGFSGGLLAGSKSKVR